MSTNRKQALFTFLLLSLLGGGGLSAQKMTSIKGEVIDAETKEPLPFANVRFVGTDVGTTTDFDGTFVLETRWGSDSLEASYLGYETQVIPIQLGVKNQKVTFALVPSAKILQEVVIKEKRGKYKRKGNPAVDLWKEVMAHKNQNLPKKFDYYEYDKYEKIELDLNNITEKFRKRKAFKKFQFIFDYVDTSELNGKPYLPIFIRETASKVYYRKDPEATKEYRQGVKVSGLEEYLDNEGISTVTDLLYRNIDIYASNILIFDKQFMSPLAPLANTFYRFYILDTIEQDGMKLIDLAFMPINKLNVGFKGDLYIKADSTYAVVKADFTITDNANLNFINDLRLVQEFQEINGAWILVKDQITVDFSPLKQSTGFFAKRSVLYDNHIFNQPREDDLYEGSIAVIDTHDVFEKDETFWDTVRLEELSVQEAGVYEMIDTLQQVPAFRRAMDIITLLVSGYKAVGPVDVGPVSAFYSFNDVEGFRARVSGQTNLKFHPKIQLEGLLAYGFKDQEWKYGASLKYSFRDNWRSFPQHHLKVSYLHDTKFVGNQLKFVQEDNFFLSFKRGASDRMLFTDRFVFEYFLELENNLSWTLSYFNTDQRPLGSLRFNFTDPVTGEKASYHSLRTSEVGLKIRYAPNEQFLQGHNYRTPIYNKYPVFTLDYKLGMDGILGGDFAYHRLSLNIFKRFYLSLFGNTRFEVEAGYIWGDGVPYFLLHLPVANQTFAYRTGAFNMMNFMEFASDRWALINIEHFFEGYFFNKIPLLRRLKLREVVSFKAIYGGLRSENNPNLDPTLVQFITTTTDGHTTPVTFTLENQPYMEASVGVYNIFKLIRIDLVKRLNYLHNPDIPQFLNVKGLGLRIKVKVEF